MSAARAVASRPAVTATVFAALGDETRLALVARLCDGGPASIAHLTQGTTVTRQAVAKHLRALERAGLARSRRHGRERRWELRTARLAQARLHLERISAQWDGALERLAKMVE
jgi:DNA-binding transcriptional ArsR family regulator